MGNIKVLFQKMSMYWNRGDLRYLMELCPGFLRMQQQNLD